MSFRIPSTRPQIIGEQCSICTEELNVENKELFSCESCTNHQFHKDCIDQWVQHHNVCPLCRAKPCRLTDIGRLVKAILNNPQDKLNIITLALRNGADVNSQVFNETGVEIGPLPFNHDEPWDIRYNAMFLAARSGYVDVMNLMATNSQHPINFNLGATNGDTPLGEAVFHNQIEMVQWFINNNKDIHFRDEFGWAPIHIAANAGKLEILKLLHQAGAHINSVVNGGNSIGMSPLALACEREHLDMIQYLLAHGASPENIDIVNLTPDVKRLILQSRQSSAASAAPPAAGGGGGGASAQPTALPWIHAAHAPRTPPP